MLHIAPMQGAVFRSTPSRLSFHFCNTFSRRISLSRIAWCSDSTSSDAEPKSSASPVNPNSNSSRLSEILLSDSSLNPFSNVPPPPSFTGRPGRYVVGRTSSNYEDFRSVGSRSDPSLPSIPGKFSKYSKQIRNLSSNAPERNQRPNKKPYRKPMSNVRSPVRPSPQSPYDPPGHYDSDFSREDELEFEAESDSDTSVIDEYQPAPASVARKKPQIVSKMPAWMEQYRYSYSEVPKAPILGFRETPYSPFGPQDMVSRPWTGSAPLKPQKKKPPEFDSFNPPPTKKGVKYVQKPGPFPPGQGPKPAKTREEILGEPLTPQEVKELVETCIKSKKMVNLGRDGLTHNMLEVIHTHWKRSVCCRIRCKGVPTVDMDNLVQVIEEKTGGVVISRAGGTVYLFRGRNYNYKDRPKIPLMLWKPPTPIYPKLIVPVPEGLTEEEAKLLRGKARRTEPLCKLSKNGVYLNLVEDVRAQFTVDEVVRVDCTGLNPSDYKKIGAKLKDLVPCVLLSFEKEQIMMWRGKRAEETSSNEVEAEKTDDATLVSAESSVDSEVTEVDLLFQQAIEEGKAVQLRDDVEDPDLIFKKAAELSESVKFLDMDVSSEQAETLEPNTEKDPTKKIGAEPTPTKSPFVAPPPGGLGLDELAKLLRQ